MHVKSFLNGMKITLFLICSQFLFFTQEEEKREAFVLPAEPVVLDGRKLVEAVFLDFTHHSILTSIELFVSPPLTIAWM